MLLFPGSKPTINLKDAHRSRKSATRWKSDCTKPRVVRAGEPMRTPPGTTADLSPGTLFLFSVMAARSSTCRHQGVHDRNAETVLHWLTLKFS